MIRKWRFLDIDLDYLRTVGARQFRKSCSRVNHSRRAHKQEDIARARGRDRLAPHVLWKSFTEPHDAWASQPAALALRRKVRQSWT